MLFLYKCVYSCVYLYILSDYIYIYIYIVAVIEDPESSGGPSCEAIWHSSTPTQNSSVISQCFQGVLKQVPAQCQLPVYQGPPFHHKSWWEGKSTSPSTGQPWRDIPSPSTGQILEDNYCTVSRCIQTEEVRNMKPSEVLQYQNLTSDENYVIWNYLCDLSWTPNK